jgi:NhaP-type Na+/H+ or K+/H+ antiporter
MQDPLFLLSLIVFLGALGHWIAWRVKIPAIILLLGFGFLVGPVLGILDPDQLFGSMLFPLVSFAVALILLEGGLSLKMSELKHSGSIIFRLVSVGVLVCWVLTTLFAYLLLDLPIKICLLMGAILVITGPTVIGPMLKSLRPKGNLRSIAKWEGILNDPIGALIAVLVFEVILVGSIMQAPTVFGAGIFRTLVVALSFGAGSAAVIIFASKKKLLPEFLHSTVVLAFAVMSFAVSNYFQHESGLLTVTVLGIVLANQKVIRIDHVVVFKENLQLILLAVVFIILSAKTNLDMIRTGWNSLLFAFSLIFIVRPISVLVSTIKTDLSLREKCFLMLTAPRGAVVLALTSVFVFRLEALGFEEGNAILGNILLVVIVTVLFYGFAAGPIGRWLQISNQNAVGLLVIGAHQWSRRIVSELQSHGATVKLIDSNARNASFARRLGLEVYVGNVFSEEFLENLELSDIRQMIAWTANDHVNSFAEEHLADIIDPSEIYHLIPDNEKSHSYGDQTTKNNPIFSSKASYSQITEWFDQGAKVRTEPYSEKCIDDYKAGAKRRKIPLFVIQKSGMLSVCYAGQMPTPKDDSTILYLDLSELVKEA